MTPPIALGHRAPAIGHGSDNITHPVHDGAGGGLLHTILRGFAWRTGSDVANEVFHVAPLLITAVVIIVAIILGIRWLRRRNRV